MNRRYIEYIVIGIGFILIFLLGLNADTRSIERDLEILKEISVIQQATETNQKAIIHIFNSLNEP